MLVLQFESLRARQQPDRHHFIPSFIVRRRCRKGRSPKVFSIVGVPCRAPASSFTRFAFLHLDLYLWPSSKLPHRFLGHFGPAESSGELRTRDPRRNASCSAKQRATDIMGKLNQCNRCDRVSLVPLRALKHPPDTSVWKLEAALYCEPAARAGTTAAGSARISSG